MLNNNILVDLHIHSNNSSYKDGDLVKDSTIDKLDLLIEKLNDNDICLCAVTDHNRFDYDLYCELRKKINSGSFSLKKNLPGIEFDVVLEEDRPSCHIIAIFNDNDEHKIKQIQDKLFDCRKLNEQNESYLLKEFEEILKNIGLDVILIAHQRQGFDNQNEKTKSISSATSNIKEFLKIGFVDSLEYNYPRVEGIVKRSLRDVDVSFPVITGSDCHDWNYYPYHDKNEADKKKDFSRIKCLPTFKGLLLAITSFETRFNRFKNQDSLFLKSISINDTVCPLSSGINAIIGDNGSGKSMLVDYLAGKNSRIYAPIRTKNKITASYGSELLLPEYITYIAQNSISEQVRTGELFEENNTFYYKNIETKELFSQQIFLFFDEVCSYIRGNITKRRAIDALDGCRLSIKPLSNDYYYPVIDASIMTDDTSIDEERLRAIQEINNKIEKEIKLNYDYYRTLNITNSLDKLSRMANNIKEAIQKEKSKKDRKNTVKGIIMQHLRKLKDNYDDHRTSEEMNRVAELNKIKDFKDRIIKAVTENNKELQFPLFPDKINGISVNDYKGYRFVRVAKYHDTNLEEEFYNYCFNKDFNTADAIKHINTESDFSKALSNYNYSQIDDFRNHKVRSFIDNYLTEQSYITEISSNTPIGNTPGEVSLVYYKFLIQDSDEKYSVLIIDQPEDDINPERIKRFLNVYLKTIRDQKQIILVTHNPLLVVNLDVDNLIFLQKDGDMITAKSGCLEYEDDNYSVLDLVRDNLDGGYNAIERRLRLYGRD